MNRKRIATVLGVMLAVVGAGAGRAEEPGRLYLTVDKTQVLSFASAVVNRISVTNPAIADVHVVSPMQVLLSGKAPGQTSLVVFHPGRTAYFDVIVHPAPVSGNGTRLVPAAEHGVEVLRAGRASHQLFVRDTTHAWVELGAPGAAPQAAKK